MSPAGWLGILAGLLGLAYFLVPEETAQQRSERKPLPETREAAAPATANRNEVVAPAARDKTAAPPSAETERYAAPSAKQPAARSERSRVEPASDGTAGSAASAK